MVEVRGTTKDMENSDPALSQPTFITVVITTFTTVFMAELGDKTQIATMLLTAQSGKPLIVFMGAAAALVSSSLVGVVVGRWISNQMPLERFKYIAGCVMICLGIWIGATSNSLVNP